MRRILMQARSKTFPLDAMWDRIIDLENYPKWVKYCKSMHVTEVKEGAIFHDVTTLLWIPLKVKHIITKIKPFEELSFFLTLPGRGKMWHTATFKQEDNYAQIQAELIFDLGNRFFNATVGYVLEKRWENLMRNVFPEIEEIKRLH